jgi:hypothetical protein
MDPKTDDTTAMQDNPETETDAAPADGSYDVKLDMTNPDISDAFANCEVGEQLTVKSKDENEIVLSKEPEPEAGNEGEEPAPSATEPKSAVGILLAKKMSR